MAILIKLGISEYMLNRTKDWNDCMAAEKKETTSCNWHISRANSMGKME